MIAGHVLKSKISVHKCSVFARIAREDGKTQGRKPIQNEREIED